jgi:hypothetical protein
MSTIETAIEEWKNKVKTTRTVVVARYVKEENKEAKANKKADGKSNEDQEKEDVEMKDTDIMSSSKDVSTRLTASGNTSAASMATGKRKGTVLTKWDGTPWVGGKDDSDQENRKKPHDDDEEWKQFFFYK